MMSGQLVNFHESAFQCIANVPSATCENFKNILNMNNELSLSNYLGCPIIYSKNF